MIYTCTGDSELSAWLFGFAAGFAPAVVVIGTARRIGVRLAASAKVEKITQSNAAMSDSARAKT